MTNKKTPVKAGQEQTNRTPQGRFKSGTSGNPKGRSVGSRHKATEAALSLLEGEAEALTRKAVELALDGDITALRLCLERIVPSVKERPLTPLDLPSVTEAADLPALTQRILEAEAAGEVLPSQAAALSALVASHAKAIELSDFEARLARLEEAAHEE